MRRLALSLLVLAGACGGDGGTITVCAADEQCDDGVWCNGVERCAPDEESASAIGCVGGARPCALGEACLEVDDQCDTGCVTPDGDGDGIDRVACGGTDCDDEDAERFPGNPEVCDDAGHDEDCDLNTVGALDRDRDGFVDDRCRNEGGAAGVDCNDAEPTVSPVSEEACNGRDDDCDGDVDEGVSVDGYWDADADGHGDPAMPLRACIGRARFSLLSDDCDDGSPAIFSGQIEICDGEDNDCDGFFDEGTRPVFWFPDADADGYGDGAGVPELSCDPLEGYALLPIDCDDGDATVSPIVVESCNGRDDDCNGIADFVAGPGDLEDDDRDGVPDESCGGADCDDRDPFVAGGFDELCNGRDDDCDGMIDEATTATDWFVDRDGDTFGAGAPMRMCVVGSGFVPRAGDCDDADRQVVPGAIERCNGTDDDCDGSIDEGATARCSGPNAVYVCADGACQVSRCTGYSGDCDGNAANGCEADLWSSLAHCGGCGRTCTGACTNGGCSTGTAPLLTITVEDLDGAPIAGALVSEPHIASSWQYATAADGTTVIRPDSPTWYRFEAEGFYPSIYPADRLGFTTFTPFGGGYTVVLPRESEAAAFAGPPTPTRGMLLVRRDGPVLAAGETQPVILSLESGATFHAPNATRPLPLSAGAFFDGSSALVLFTEVTPGAAALLAPGCSVPETDVRVYPGALTIARVRCP